MMRDSHLSRLAFFAVKIDLPDLASISLRVFPAMIPPCCAISRFSSNPSGCFWWDISVVVALHRPSTRATA